MYTARAQQLRRCKANRKDGKPCKGWVCWSDPAQLCNKHGGKSLERLPGRTGRRRPPPCRCSAFRFPHQPGSGSCQWPDAPSKSGKSYTPDELNESYEREDRRAYLDVIARQIRDDIARDFGTPSSWP